PDQQFLFSDAPYTTGTFVTLWELFDPIGTPFLVGTNVPVTASRVPTNADQLGGSATLIDGGINRSFRHAPVYRDGHMWGVQGVAGGTNNAFAFVRYLRINVSTYKAVDDAAFGADNFWYIYPAAMPDANGNLFINFTRSGLTEYPSARFTGRLAADPPGLQASTLLKAGEANYVKTFGGARNRWGDYLGIALDPADDSKVWMLGQYAESEVGAGASADRWGTWFGATSFTPLSGKHLRFEPDSLAFGTFELGQKSLAHPMTLSNIGTNNVTVASVSVSTPSFILSGVPALPKTLASFNDLSFSVAFEPMQAGALRDTIKIRDSGNQTLFAIPLLGRALGAATLQGTVRDSFTNSPIQARLQFFRGSETTPRATDTTAADGSYSALVLEGEYTIDLLPEIPYAPKRSSLTHTFGGTTFDFALAPASVVLVNDDSVAANLEIYKTQLTQLGYAYALWNVRAEGATVPANRLPLLAPPRIMVWFTGETKAEVLTQADRNAIISHLEQSSPVLLSGDNIAETTAANDSLFAKYFGLAFNGNFSSTLIRGFAGDPIGNGVLTGAQGGTKDIFKFTASTFSSRSPAFRYVASATDTVTTRLAGVRVEIATQGRAAVFGFRLEATSATTRRTIFERTLNWLKDPGVAVAERPASQPPENFYLSQNHPNPFNPATTITFHLPQATFATLRVYDLSGRAIATLVSDRRAAGEHRVVFEARDLAAGVYFYRLQAGENLATRKLVLLR
ncbi:MAG: T9SS type A sorting domain-containing protein, partial [candidate division KSB1 bacterium]